MENFLSKERRDQVGVMFLVFLIIISFFFVVLSINELRKSERISNPYEATIYVRGEGEVFAVPDLATFTFTAEAEEDSVEAAQAEAARIANSAIAFLEGEGVEEKDIKTIGYNAYPRYEYNRGGEIEIYPYYPEGNRELAGYTVSQTIEVKVREADRAGELLSGVGSLGVTNLSGINFTIDDDDALRAEARALAIADAQAKAEVLAEDLGVRLGRIVSFSDESDGYPYPLYGYGKGGVSLDAASEAAVRQAPDLPSGENSIMSFVTITYEIK